MHGTYIPNQKFDSITISVLSNSMKMRKTSTILKMPRKFISRNNNASNFLRNW